MKITKEKLKDWAVNLVPMFDDIIKNKNSDMKNIKVSTGLALGINIEEVRIVDNPTTKFFGMCLIPLGYYKKKAIVNILKGKMVSQHEFLNGDFIIEIDHKVFDKRLNLNAEELTAMFLHEIGHIIFSNEQNEIISKAINKLRLVKGLQIGLLINAITKSNVILNLFSMLLMEAYSIRKKRKASIDVEKSSDLFVINLGFGDQLNNCIYKIIESAMSEIECVYTVDEQVEQIFKFGLSTISNLKIRSDDLSELASQTSTAYEGRYIQRYAKVLINVLITTPRDLYKVMSMVNEAVTDEPLEVISEGILEKMFGWRRGLYLENDIDDIRVFVDDIKDVDDKTELLSMIHKRIDTSRYAIKKINRNGVSDGLDKPTELARIDSYIEQLESLRKETLRVKLPSKRIGVFDENGDISIPYPTGYTG